MVRDRNVAAEGLGTALRPLFTPDPRLSMRLSSVCAMTPSRVLTFHQLWKKTKAIVIKGIDKGIHETPITPVDSLRR